MDLKIDSKYTLPIIRIEQFNGKEYFVVNLDGEEVRVTKFPHQSSRNKSLNCIYKGKHTITGRPTLRQDLVDVLYEIYEEDCDYEFTIEEKCIDPNSNAEYCLLSDDYGFSHRLYIIKDSRLELIKGAKVKCKVITIKNGHLVLAESDRSQKIDDTYQLASKMPVELSRVNFSELNPDEDASLRDYQVENKRKIYEAWQSHRSVMLQMPTGTGKTRLFVSIAKDLHNWGAKNKMAVKILILAHRKELIDQISTNVGVRYGLAHGLIVSQNQENRLYPVQVGSVPTLNRRLEKWSDKDFDVIIIDEAHHVKANSYKKILSEYPTARILGVTATPYRLNGAGFRPEFDELIISPSVAEFIKRGYLCEYDYYSIKSESLLQNQINNMALNLDGDYLDSAMMDVMDRDSIRAGIIETYLKIAKGKKGIVYTVNCDHNRHICEKFISEGVKAVAIDSDTPKEKRDEIVRNFRNGKIDVLCNVNIFSEGFDCPDVEFIQLARPTKSLSLFLQQIGRGLRPCAGKERAIILDNVGLYNKFGFPSARRKWRYHFEGRDVNDETVYSGIKGDEIREVFDIEEGNDEVNLLHSSEVEIIEDMNSTYQPLEDSLESSFKAYLENIGLADVTIRNYLRVIGVNLDNLVKDECNPAHPGFFYISDPIEVQRILDKLRTLKTFDEFNNIRHNAGTASLGKYIKFLSGRNNTQVQEQLLPFNDTESLEEELSKLMAAIAYMESNGFPIPQEMLSKKEQLQQQQEESKTLSIVNDIRTKVQNYITRNSLTGVSFTIEYTPGSGTDINISEIKDYKSTSTPKIELAPIKPKSSSRAASKKILITFPNGEIIEDGNAAETLASFIRFVGATRVREMNIYRNKVELVSDEISSIYKHSQKPVGSGLHVMTNYPIEKKIEDIMAISQRFGLNVKVEII